MSSWFKLPRQLPTADLRDKIFSVILAEYLSILLLKRPNGQVWEEKNWYNTTLI